MFRLIKIPVYFSVIVPKTTKDKQKQGNKQKPGSETLYETIDEFNEVWADLKRK